MALHFPATCPATIRTRLQALAKAGQLSGVAPQVLAAICRFTSNYGQPTLAVNATDFGGYFGQHVGWAYPTRPQGFTAAELTTPSMFWAQAEVAAATLAGYMTTLGPALATYASGTVSGWEQTELVRYVAGATGADMTGPTVTPPKKEVHKMSIGILDFDNAQWSVFATGGQLKRHHLSGPNEVRGLLDLGAVQLSRAPWNDNQFVASLPVV